MINNLYCCDKCKSAEHSIEFRLDAKNFHQMTLSSYPVTGGPHMMPGQDAAQLRNETYQICSECKPEIDAALDAIVNPLKA